jgi:PAS domain S-box-containing protein
MSTPGAPAIESGETQHSVLASDCAAELCATTEQLRTIVEHAPEAIAVFDCDGGRFVLCNESATKLFGLTRQQFLQTEVLAVSPEFQADGQPSRKLVRERIAEALAGDTPTFEWLFRDARGHVIPCEVRLVRLPGDSQQLIRGSIVDMRDRKRREKTQHATYEISQAVHETEDLDRLYERIHSIVRTLMPADNFYIVLNDPVAGHHFYAYHVDLVDSRPAPRVMKEGLNGYVLHTGKALLANKASMTDARNAWRLKSGTPSAIWVGAPLEVRGQNFGLIAVQDYENERAYGEDEKQILAYVGKQIALAIDRKRAEQALRESEEKFRALFEASGQGVILHDEKQLLEVNPATVRILGFNCAEEIIGHHPVEFAAPVQPGGAPPEVLAKRYIEQCLTHGSARFDWICKNPQGKEIPIEVNLTRIQWSGRQVIQAVINDITERKNAEAELLKALAKEKQLGELKSNFVSMVSHEFRTPLGIIMSSAEILQHYLEHLPAEERNEHLKSITKNTRRMADLMEEVLLLGRFEAGKMDFQPKPLDLRSFCQRLVDEVLSAADCRSPITVDCPALSGEAYGDERLLRHILLNVLTNALKYSECGQPIRFSIQRDGRDAVCHIVDRGIGIPEPDRERLFNAFHRGRNVGQRAGTGLGLVIVKRCLDLHGGRVEIDSKIGEGTTVTMRIPVFTSES